MRQPRFLLDGMLGGLSRWLRITGYDTLYYVDKDDENLLLEARDSGRILVTRDMVLHRKAKKHDVPSICLSSEKTLEQLSELARQMGLVLAPRNIRCTRCNGLLEPIGKNEVKDKVPPSSFNAFNEYWICSDCGAVYWKGSHWNRIKDVLAGLTKSL